MINLIKSGLNYAFPTVSWDLNCEYFWVLGRSLGNALESPVVFIEKKTTERLISMHYWKHTLAAAANKRLGSVRKVWVELKMRRAKLSPQYLIIYRLPYPLNKIEPVGTGNRARQGDEVAPGRQVFGLSGVPGLTALITWLTWARKRGRS